MEMTPQAWAATSAYLSEVFGALRKDETAGTAISELPARAAAAGLPSIAVSPDVGRLLEVLALTATHGADAKGRIIEVGTLGGYSALWMARGLPPRGRLTTVELEPGHAAFARGRFAAAGVQDRLEVIEGAALSVLPGLAARLGPASVDMIFLDAVKHEYADYLRLLRPTLRVGGLLVADNALGAGDWGMADNPARLPQEARRSREAVDRFNRAMAADEDFRTACVPIREGVLIAARVR